MAGALDAFNDPATQGLLSLSASLLQAGGPSATPVPLGAAMGNAYQGYQANQQRQALVGLEQQKAALAGTQVAQAQYQIQRQNWALGGFQGPPPTPPQMPGQGMPQAPQAAPQMPVGAPPQQGQPMPPQQPGAAPASAGGPMAGLPQYLQDAARYKMGGLPEIGTAIEKANEPIIGREGGLFHRGPNGLQLDPGWLQGEEQRQRQKLSLENQNTVVTVPLADGRQQQMTKAQQLQVVDATAPLNGLPVAVVGDIQRQLLADPEKPVDVNITLNGRSTKMTIPALKGPLPGVTAGQSTEARSAAEKSGMNAGDVQSQIDQEAAHAQQARVILGEMKTLAQDFTPGKLAPMQRALGEWAQATGLKGFEDQIKSADSQQALQKLTAQMATAAMKQFTNRGTQMEFKTFLQNNPNAELTPGGFQKVLGFMDKTFETSLQKQQAYQEWRKNNPVERSQDFLAEWNKRQSAEPTQQGPKAAPKPGEIVDGWQYVGGDPGNRMNWKKQ